MARPHPAPHPGRPAEVLAAFARLGLTSFGGPVAHLGYFRAEFVTRRRWLDDAAYADLVALCQFLPGPASSQVGFALGLMRAGWAGALAAFVGFTAPSAVALVVFALAAGPLAQASWVGAGALAGLKIVAVAIVAQAVWGMARSLCPDRARATIALAAVAVLAFVPGALGMPAAIAIGALAGLMLGRGGTGGAPPPAGPVPGDMAAPPVSRRVALLCLGLFAGLMLALPLLAPLGQGVAVADRFFRAGALVFGGGHVVLPLLETGVVRPGWVTPEVFLAGYGAAQAVPGPLFTFAAYLGALLDPGPGGIAGAVLALGAVFAPGFLVLVGVLPFWHGLRARAGARAALRGANAAVVGILGTALYTPVFTGAVTDLRSFALALACFVLLTVWKAPPWAVVILAALGGIGLSMPG
ncbi:chromate efflux transporter [Pontitalea aquivivens]|uniref:chromate efflux transporter n=1 Tax=Pontitalea aquivivens TaxID=3388663 RepID=UPI003970EBCE